MNETWALIRVHKAQVISSVVGAVRNFLTECGGSTVSNNETLRDYLVTRLEATLTNVEELMHYVGAGRQLIQLRSHIREYLHRFHAYNNICTQPVEGINTSSVVLRSGSCGRQFLPIDQVEMLRGIGYTWQEVANAVGISRTTLGDVSERRI